MPDNPETSPQETTPTETSRPGSAAPAPSTGAPAVGDAIPRTDQWTLPTTLSDEHIRRTLAQSAKRGKLAGLHTGTRDAVFRVTDFGSPFESVLAATREPDGLTLTRSLKRKLPAVYVGVLVLTVWPGVWLTDSMLTVYFDNTLIAKYTYWWYLPLTIPFVPLAIRSAIRKSVTSGRAEAGELAHKIAGLLGTAASPIDQDSPTRPSG